MSKKDKDGFVGRVGDYLVALTEEDIALMRNRFHVPQHLKASLKDAEENLRVTHSCGIQHVQFIAFSNGAFGLCVSRLHDVARYVRACFDQDDED